MSIAIPEPVSIVYKTIDGVSLSLDVYADSHTSQVKPRPAIVFFHGGGLVSPTSSYSSLWSRAPIGVASVFFSTRRSPPLKRQAASRYPNGSNSLPRVPPSYPYHGIALATTIDAGLHIGAFGIHG
jgi:hypothetical protein